MKSVNVKISDEAYKILFNYKMDNKLNNLDLTLNEILLLLEGREKKNE